MQIERKSPANTAAITPISQNDRPFEIRMAAAALILVPKNSEISGAGMAPSRKMRQRASSSVRSTIVDATSRGEVPAVDDNGDPILKS